MSAERPGPMPGAAGARGLRVGPDGRAEIARALPEEAPVALVYHGESHAVMMATPADLEDLALGFSLTEGFAARAEEVEETEIVAHGGGMEARMTLSAPAADRLAARRRSMAGPVGCGLCGIESIEAALRPAPPVAPGPALPLEDIAAALEALRGAQPLHDRVRAVHAAGFWRPGGQGGGGQGSGGQGGISGARTGAILTAREDVGRHNALDKLIGALARSGAPVAGGAAVLSSRISVEMVQKCAMAGIGAVLAPSAPTALAVEAAAAAGIGLAVPAPGGGADLFAAAARFGL